MDQEFVLMLCHLLISIVMPHELIRIEVMKVTSVDEEILRIFLIWDELLKHLEMK